MRRFALHTALTVVLGLLPGTVGIAQDVPDAALAAVDAKLSSGAWQDAAAGAGALLDDPARAGAAWARLGAALEKGGYPYAALAAYARGVKLAPAAGADRLPAALTLADRYDDDVWFGGIAGADFSVPMSADTRAHVALVAARSLVADGAWGPALGLLPLIPDGSPYALDAKVLEGVALAQQSRYNDALVPLLTAYEQARRSDRDPHYVATLAMNVARTFFAAGNFGRAMEYYDRVGRDDAGYLEAHFERAWAHFRVDDIPGTIALLHTHQSPFFESWYFPEADMLRAQSLFLMCKFPETKKVIDSFQARYTPLRSQLVQALVGMDAQGAWSDAVTFLGGGTSKLPVTVLRRLRSDEGFAATVDAVAEADAELTRLAAERSPWATRVAEVLKARRDARSSAGGTKVLGLATSASDDLKEMLQDIELTRVDLLTFEADLYSRAAVTGESVAFGDKVAAYRELRRKGKQVWPFEGEYWADELGWYRVEARPDCPQSLQRRED